MQKSISRPLPLLLLIFPVVVQMSLFVLYILRIFTITNKAQLSLALFFFQATIISYSGCPKCSQYSSQKSRLHCLLGLLSLFIYISQFIAIQQNKFNKTLQYSVSPPITKRSFAVQGLLLCYFHIYIWSCGGQG